MLTKLVNKLAWIIRLLHALVLHKPNNVLPVLNCELMPILVFCVKPFNDHGERFHAYLPKRIILAETALKLTSLRREEPLTFEVIQGRVVKDFTCGFFKKVYAHLGGTRSFISSNGNLLGHRQLANWR